MKSAYKLIATSGILAVALFAFAGNAFAATAVNVSNLQPSWGVPGDGGGGVYSAYYTGPYNSRTIVSPGNTAVHDGSQAGIIKAGFVTVEPWDEGLFGFKPSEPSTVTINDFANMPLTYVVENQTDANPVWMTIEVGDPVNRDTNKSYQFFPTSNQTGWHTVNAAAGQWQQWTTYTSGIATGSPMTLSEVASANTGLSVVRAYLRLGQGDSYSNGGTGTTAWVNQATLGGVTYNFITADTATALASAKTAAHTALNTALATYTQANYTAENWTTLTGFNTKGDGNITEATTLGDVTSALNTATAGMAGVQTAPVTGGRSGGHRSPNSATPATPAVPGVSPAVPATPSINSNNNAVGQVLGAFTGPEGTNLDTPAMTAVKVQIKGLIQQLINLLQGQLSALIAAGQH